MRREQLYLDMDALGVGLGSSHWQVRDRKQIQRTEAPNNGAVQPIVFGGKV